MRRTEIKFEAERFQLAGFYKYISSRNSCMLHAPRIVNSLYFDTFDFAMFRETREGITPRKKYRLRWYGREGPAGKKVSVEVKETRSSGRSKIVEALNSSAPLLSEAQLNPYGLIVPVLRVSYLREYFLVDDLRLTIDHEISYHYPDDLDSGIGGYLSDSAAVEVKSPNAHLEAKITSDLGMKTRHFSKFEEGMSILHESRTQRHS